MNIPKSIFRAYDIRGLVDTELNEEVAYKIGQALGYHALLQENKEIVVGYDGRPSSPRLAEAIQAGMHAVGCNSRDVGMVPTPVAYWAAWDRSNACCAMITGSHNPKEYNGVKMMLGGTTLADEYVMRIYDAIIEDDFTIDNTGKKIADTAAVDDYCERLVSTREVTRKIKVVVDCGNGVAGITALPVLEKFGVEVVPLFTDVDGDFPNHHPDPADLNNFAHAKEALAQHPDAEIALAFDGDGDRLGVWLPDSGVVFPDRVLIAFIRHVFEKNPGQKVPIICDVKCSSRVPMEVHEHGGEPIIVRTGHSFVKDALIKHRAPLAGEFSGHFFFWHTAGWLFDDALYAAVLVLELAAKYASAEAFFATVEDFPCTPEIKIDLPAETDTKALIEGMRREDYYPAALLMDVDGIRAQWDDGFGLVRASNTTTALILRFEGKDQEALERIQACFRNALSAVLPDTKFDFL